MDGHYLATKLADTAGKVATLCENSLKELRTVAEMSKSRAARLKWLVGKSRAAEIQMRLNSLKSTLSVMLSTILLARTMSSSKNDPKTHDVQRDIDVLKSALLANQLSLRRLKKAEIDLDNEKSPDVDASSFIPEDVMKSASQQSRCSYFTRKKSGDKTSTTSPHTFSN